MSDVERTRVYVRTGQLAHLLAFGASPSGREEALCRRQPCAGTSWLGTGSQREYERAAQLRTCPRCAEKAAAG